MNYGKVLILLILVSGLFVFGCAGIGEQQTTTPQTNDNQNTAPPVVKRPSFEVLSPLDGEKISISGQTIDLPVKLEAYDLVLKSQTSKNNAGEGHFLINLDGKDVVVSIKEYTFKNVGLGDHVLKIEIKQNDGTSYVPKIVKTIKFKVEQDLSALQPKTYEVKMGGFAFSPAELEIKSGDSVTWTNNGNLPCSAVSPNNFDTGNLAKGQSKTIKFDKSGVFDYSCITYPSMKGKITVK